MGRNGLSEKLRLFVCVMDSYGKHYAFVMCAGGGFKILILNGNVASLAKAAIV